MSNSRKGRAALVKPPEPHVEAQQILEDVVGVSNQPDVLAQHEAEINGASLEAQVAQERQQRGERVTRELQALLYRNKCNLVPISHKNLLTGEERVEMQVVPQ